MKSLWVLWAYCALLLVGGTIGWTVGGSKASLISSLLSSAVLLGLSYFVAKRKRVALILCISFLAFLDTFFTYRWLVIGSAPAGMMAITSLLALLGFATLARKDLVVKPKP